MSSPANQPSPVAMTVIGTGLSGMVQAWALLQTGFPVTLIGPVPDTETKDERTTAILMPGIDYLDQLGLWDFIHDSATPLSIMELNDRSVRTIFHATDLGQESFGYNIRNAALKDALVAKLQANPDLTWHNEFTAAMHQSNTSWTITLTSGTVIESAFVIGAEGRQSPTRQEAGIAIDTLSIEQTAIVTVLQGEKPHHNTSVEWYFQGGPLTLVPMQDDRLALVWCNDRDVQQERMQRDIALLEQELTSLTEERFGVLRIVSPLQSWPVMPLRAERLVAGNCAIIGEAAHILPPIGAQGFNISLHDIMTLTGLLKRIRSAGLVPAHNPILHRYESIRMPEIAMRYRGVNALNHLLRSPSSVMHGLRRMALRGISRSTFLKTHLMQAGMVQKK